MLFLHSRSSNLQACSRTVVAVFVALTALAMLGTTAAAQTQLNAGCTTDVEWTIGGGDTVATVDILIVGTEGDTLYTLATGTDNDAAETLDVPCIEVDTLSARLQVIANVDVPYAFLDEAVTIVSAPPQIASTAQGGAVDENCERTVTFSATITDDCAPDTATVSVTLIGDNATLGEPDYEVVETDTSLEVNGTILVSGLTGSPALVLIEYTGTDNCGRVAMDSDTASVSDEMPPTVMCPSDVTVECTGDGGVMADDPQLVDFFAAFDADDNCDAEPALSNDAPDFFPLGVTEVTFTAMDASGNSASCSANVEVVDTTPPEISLELNRSALWPPNHKFYDIVASVDVSDICDSNPTFVLTSVESNEPSNGNGDGNTSPDIHGADTGSADTMFDLRAERSGNGDGRMYTIIYTASDMSGNTASDTATVIVPHDMRGKAMASNGYNGLGTGFDEASERIALIVPSDDGFDPTSIHLRAAQIGNIKGVVSPEEIYRGDVTGNGSDDIVLVYPASTAKELNLKAKGLKDKTSLHYADQANNHFVVYDIFDLGEPLKVDLASLEKVTFDDTGDDHAGDTGDTGGDDGTGDTGDDGSGDNGNGGPGDNGKTPVTAALSMRPNPFNPTTTVFYSLPTAGNVTVRVYDIKGRLVNTLVNRSQDAGEFSVTWSGRNADGQAVASGVYFLRMEAPGVGITRKAVMLK